MKIEPIAVSSAEISSIGCGCTIPKCFFPKNTEELDYIRVECETHDRFFIAGGLTNTLVMNVERNDVFLFSDKLRGVRVADDRMIVRAGEKTCHVANVARICGLSGMENLSLIPGTIGGGVIGNAGCFDSSFSEIVESVRLFHLDDGEIEELSAEEIAFRYRYSNLRRNVDFITEVTLRLYPDDSRKVAERMANVRQKRLERLPVGRSLGSVFKRMDGISCGYYLDKAGMKGVSVGGMRVSEKHAGIIVNTGCGTPEEYRDLVVLCEQTIQKSTGKKPEREVLIIGDDG